jgi:prepilin-type N-terminal cleavage/methylation domain-containing protein
MYYHKKLKGFSLVELIIAISIFSMAISSFAFLGVEAYRTLRTSQNRITASQKSKEIADLIMLVKNESWANIVDNTDDGIKHILNSNGVLTMEDGEKVENELTYFFSISSGYRDENGNLLEIVDEQYEDLSTRIINLTIVFPASIFGISEYNTKIYINNWNARRITQSTLDEFNTGDTNGTNVEEIGDGAITLARTFLPNWCLPQHTYSRFNLTGWAIGTELHATPGNAYVVTGKIDWGMTFLNAKISSSSPPEITIEGEYNQERGNDLYVEDGYAYISTDSAQDSVLIIDVSNTPYSKAGNYSTNSSSRAEAVYISNNYGFVGYENKIDVFDTSEKTGSRPKVNSISIGNSSARVRKMVIKQNKLYVAMSNHNSQLVIIDITNINNMSIISQTRLNNHNAASIEVSDDGNTTYIGTNRLFYRPQFFIVNTTNASAPTVLSSLQLNEMLSLADIAITQNRVVLGGISWGDNNYVVLNIDNASAPFRCGGMNISWGILALDVVEYDQKLFTYMLTLDPYYELQVIEGGLGGTDPSGEGYIEYGEYTSEIFQLDEQEVRLHAINIYGTEPANTSLKVQLKLGNLEDLQDSNWFGPNGTQNSYFSLGENLINLPQLNGKYFQYRVLMESDHTNTPVLDKIEILYD